MTITPRIIRLRDAPFYLGMDKNRFQEEVRPTLIEIPIGSHGIGFDRVDLDDWVEHYKTRYGYPASEKFRRQKWEKNEFQGFKSSAAFGTSTKGSTAGEFAKALELTHLKKQKGI